MKRRNKKKKRKEEIKSNKFDVSLFRYRRSKHQSIVEIALSSLKFKGLLVRKNLKGPKFFFLGKDKELSTHKHVCLCLSFVYSFSQ